MQTAKVVLYGHHGSLQRPNKLHNAIFRLVSEEPQAKDAPLLTSGTLTRIRA